MKLRRVKIDDIKIPETRVTARFTPEIWEQFQGSMKETGQLTPILVYETEDGLVLCDGLHRLIEARNNGETTIMATVMPGDMADVLTKNIMLDHLRGKTPVSEMVKVIGYLWKELQLDSDGIVAKTGLSRDYVEKLQKVSELTPMCLDVLDDERIGVGHAYALTRVQDPARQEMILNQLLTYHWTVSQLEDYIKQVDDIVEQRNQQPPVVEYQAPATVPCRFCGQELPPQQLASIIMCQSCSAIMYEAVAVSRREVEKEAAAARAASAGQKQ